MSGSRSGRLVSVLAWAAISVILSGASVAAEGDAKSIDIEADDGWFELKEGRYHYEGNVVVTRDRMVIHADLAEIVTSEGDIQWVLARGTPATFRQEKADGSGTIRGRAGDMKYEADAELVRLIGDAWVEQDGDELSGPTIVYNTRTERAQVGSEQDSGGEAEGDGRVRITITPKREGAKDEGGGQDDDVGEPPAPEPSDADMEAAEDEDPDETPPADDGGP